MDSLIYIPFTYEPWYSIFCWRDGGDGIGLEGGGC